MNKQSIRFIPAAAAVALMMAMGGQAYAQATTTAPTTTKDELNPNKTVEKQMPTAKETRDQRAAAKNKNTTKSKMGAEVATGSSGTQAPSLATGNAGDPSRPANSTK